MTDHDAGLAQTLNTHCLCLTVDQARLERALTTHKSALYTSVLARQPHLFSPTAVFVSQRDVLAMRQLVAAIESVIAHPVYRARVLDWAPAIAAHEPAALGVFLGYDFHLSASGPQLIEINTNAGGGLLNVVLAEAQQACCDEVSSMIAGGVPPELLEQTFVEMFRSEWQLGRGDSPLRTVAIVDVQPEEQYLFPEFQLTAELLRSHGIQAVICGPAELDLRDGALWHKDGAGIDLVYNRLTDFAFSEPASAALREAYLSGAAVVTPHPRAHALYADKRNLTLLCDPAFLRTLDLPQDIVETLVGGVPTTKLVDPAQSEALWADRKRWFFKPAAGFGSRATYRGDKLTRRVFDEILAGTYVAQARVEPPTRAVQGAGDTSLLKFDIRAYVYEREVQLLAARLYQGQTTNFRTAGGGFAPVYHSPS